MDLKSLAYLVGSTVLAFGIRRNDSTRDSSNIFSNNLTRDSSSILSNSSGSLVEHLDNARKLHGSILKSFIVGNHPDGEEFLRSLGENRIANKVFLPKLFDCSFSSLITNTAIPWDKGNADQLVLMSRWLNFPYNKKSVSLAITNKLNDFVSGIRVSFPGIQSVTPSVQLSRIFLSEKNVQEYPVNVVVLPESDNSSQVIRTFLGEKVYYFSVTTTYKYKDKDKGEEKIRIENCRFAYDEANSIYEYSLEGRTVYFNVLFDTSIGDRDRSTHTESYANWSPLPLPESDPKEDEKKKDDNKDNDKPIHTPCSTDWAVIAGSAAGGFVGGLGIAALVWCIKEKQRKKAEMLNRYINPDPNVNPSIELPVNPLQQSQYNPPEQQQPEYDPQYDPQQYDSQQPRSQQYPQQQRYCYNPNSFFGGSYGEQDAYTQNVRYQTDNYDYSVKQTDNRLRLSETQYNVLLKLVRGKRANDPDYDPKIPANPSQHISSEDYNNFKEVFTTKTTFKEFAFPLIRKDKTDTVTDSYDVAMHNFKERIEKMRQHGILNLKYANRDFPTSAFTDLSKHYRKVKGFKGETQYEKQQGDEEQYKYNKVHYFIDLVDKIFINLGSNETLRSDLVHGFDESPLFSRSGLELDTTPKRYYVLDYVFLEKGILTFAYVYGNHGEDYQRTNMRSEDYVREIIWYYKQNLRYNEILTSYSNIPGCSGTEAEVVKLLSDHALYCACYLVTHLYLCLSSYK